MLPALPEHWSTPGVPGTTSPARMLQLSGGSTASSLLPAASTALSHGLRSAPGELQDQVMARGCWKAPLRLGQNSLEGELSLPGALQWDLSPPPGFVDSLMTLEGFVSGYSTILFAGLPLVAPPPYFSSFSAFQQLREGWMEQFSSWPWISLSPRK